MPNSHRTIGRAITCLLFASCIAFPAAAQNAIDDLGDLQVLDMSSDGSLVLGYRNSARTVTML